MKYTIGVRSRIVPEPREDRLDSGVEEHKHLGDNGRLWREHLSPGQERETLIIPSVYYWGRRRPERLGDQRFEIGVDLCRRVRGRVPPTGGGSGCPTARALPVWAVQKNWWPVSVVGRTTKG